MKSKAGAQINQSILDGISVLQALASSDEPVGGKEISERLALESTRVNRLLKTLASIGMTQQTPDRKYTPGPGIHVLAAQSLYASGLLRSAIPSLEGLSRFNFTVAMGLLWFDTVSFIYHARPGMTAAEGIGRIGLRPATSSGIGMILLANSEQEAIADVYRDREIPNFPGGLDDLFKELEEINKLGYARFQVQTEDQQEPNLSFTIAVGVGQPINSAIALQGDISEERTPEIVTALNDSKRKIEALLHKNKPTE